MNVPIITNITPSTDTAPAPVPSEMSASVHVADTSDAVVSSRLLQSLPANLGQSFDLSA